MKNSAAIIAFNNAICSPPTTPFFLSLLLSSKRSLSLSLANTHIHTRSYYPSLSSLQALALLSLDRLLRPYFARNKFPGSGTFSGKWAGLSTATRAFDSQSNRSAALRTVRSDHLSASLSLSLLVTAGSLRGREGGRGGGGRGGAHKKFLSSIVEKLERAKLSFSQKEVSWFWGWKKLDPPPFTFSHSLSLSLCLSLSHTHTHTHTTSLALTRSHSRGSLHSSFFIRFSSYNEFCWRESEAECLRHFYFYRTDKRKF